MDPARRIEVRLLGPVEVAVDGQPVDLGGVRQRLLVARLGLSVGRPVPVATLLTLLWPDDVPDSAANNLQSYVSRVRRRIGKDLITKEPGGYRLALPHSCVDACRVEDLLLQLDQLDLPDRLQQLDAARRLWRGTSLSDVTDWLGLLPDSVRLDELRVRVLALWSEAVLASDRPDLALSVLPALAAQHPTSEALQLPLMEALGRSGRTDDALRVGHRLRVALGATSGLEPSDRATVLERRLLAEPGVEVTTTRPSLRCPLPPRNTFIGRRRELDELAAAIDRPGIVEVLGPPGIGKTRLILEHLRTTTTGRPVRFVDLGTPSGRDELATILANTLGASDGRSPTAGPDAITPGSILVCDRCDHVASNTIDLLSSLARCGDDVTIIGGSRKRRFPDARCIAVAPLSTDEAMQLLLDRTGEQLPSFDPASVRRTAMATLLGLADGLPLAVELLSRRARMVGIDELARCASTDDVAASAADLLPELLEQLDRSYRGVSTAGRRLLGRLSVSAGSFELTRVEQLTDRPVSTVTELIEASLVVVEHGDAVRYRLLTPVRAIGLGHLDGGAGPEPSSAQAPGQRPARIEQGRNGSMVS